jgi:hypothetical protein
MESMQAACLKIQGLVVFRMLINIIWRAMRENLVFLSTPFCVHEIHVVIKLCLEPRYDDPFEHIASDVLVHQIIMGQ